MPERSARSAPTPDRRVLEMQADICRGLAHPVRLEVVHLLGQREVSFGELVAAMRITKPKLSQHLAVLKQAGIVVARRERARVTYSLKYPEVEAACQAVANILARHLTEVRANTDILIRTVRRSAGAGA